MRVSSVFIRVYEEKPALRGNQSKAKQSQLKPKPMLRWASFSGLNELGRGYMMLTAMGGTGLEHSPLAWPKTAISTRRRAKNGAPEARKAEGVLAGADKLLATADNDKGANDPQKASEHNAGHLASILAENRDLASVVAAWESLTSEVREAIILLTRR
jgi:hypothetical protein